MYCLIGIEILCRLLSVDLSNQSETRKRVVVLKFKITQIPVLYRLMGCQY